MRVPWQCIDGFDLFILQGLFLAPQMVAEALIGADLVACVFEGIGFAVRPLRPSPSHVALPPDARGSPRTPRAEPRRLARPLQPSWRRVKRLGFDAQ